MKNTKQGKGQKKNREVPRRRAFPWPLLFSVLFGAAALLLILGLLGAGKAAFFEKISQIAKGLFGSLRAVSPLAFIWMCVQCARRAARRSVPVLRILADGLLILCLLAAVEIFFCAKVEEEKGVALSAFDFVRKAYDVGRGGGAAGGVLAYPLYKGVGKWLGFILILLACVLQLILTGRLKRLLGCFRSGSQSDDSMLDHAFDEPAAPPKKPRQASGRSRSLYREDIVESPAPRPSRPDPAKADSQAPKTAGNRRRSVEYDGIGDDKSRAEDAKKQPPVQEEASKPKESKPETVKPEYVPGAKPRPAPKRTGETAKEDPEMEHLHIEPDNYEPILPEDEPVSKPLPKFKRPESVQKEAEEGYNYPPIDLLEEGARSEASADSSADLQKAHLLEDTLKSFGIATKLTGIAHGPAVTRFELQPAPGVKVSRITSLSDDIALNLAALSVRIEAPIPGKAAVGVEVPNDKIETVSLRDVLESPDARKHTSRVAVGLGKDNSGRYIIADVAKMPHVLIAGQTGSGKSVCINSIIVSILYRASPDEVKLILIDPKVVELSVYNGIPHLIAPVVTDPRKAASALDWAVVEMTNRYKKFAERGVRDIKGYNKALKDDEKPMPHMVIIIDELADLMMVSPGEVEDSICRLAQLARAAGMHLVIATQRPSVNVITGIIKANIPTRIAFLVASQVDSRTIIDHGGAEKLLGHGDMLYVPAGIQKPMRVQGSWVSDEEVHAIVEYIKERHEADYDEDVLEHINNAVKSDAEKEEAADEYDPRLPEAIEIVMEAGQASISMLQRRMRVGYARAGRLIDEMYQRGIVSEGEGAKPRNVTITREQFNQMFDGEN